jgi:hypothetical protein
MMETTLFVPHAIIFILDPNGKDIIIPEYDPISITSSNESCVSVGTRSDVDGEVTIQFGPSIPPPVKTICAQVFYGKVNTPTKQLAVITSNRDVIFCLGVKDLRTSISVGVNDLNNPSLVWIEVCRAPDLSNDNDKIYE